MGDGLDSTRLSPSRSTTNPECRVYPRVAESKHHAYIIITTLTQELQGLKYSKEICDPNEQYKHLYLLESKVDYQRYLRGNKLK